MQGSGAVAQAAAEWNLDEFALERIEATRRDCGLLPLNQCEETFGNRPGLVQIAAALAVDGPASRAVKEFDQESVCIRAPGQGQLQKAELAIPGCRYPGRPRAVRLLGQIRRP